MFRSAEAAVDPGKKKKMTQSISRAERRFGVPRLGVRASSVTARTQRPPTAYRSNRADYITEPNLGHSGIRPQRRDHRPQAARPQAARPQAARP